MRTSIILMGMYTCLMLVASPFGLLGQDRERTRSGTKPNTSMPKSDPNRQQIDISALQKSAASQGRELNLSDLAMTSATAALYCIPSSDCAEDYISRVVLNTLDNTDYCSSGGYFNYLPGGHVTTTLKRGSSYTISLTPGGSFSQAFGVWIDYNDNGSFGDAGEFVANASPTAATVSKSFTVPAGTSSGLRRMRVRCRYNSAFTAAESCSSYSLGETEDYTLTIGYCVPEIYTSCSAGDYIDRFTLNTLSNISSNCNGQERNYVNYLPSGSLTTTVYKGLTYNLSLQSGSNAQGFGIWIDYNNDQDFTDAGEFVYSTPTYGTSLFTGSVTIPATGVSAGQKRLRVRAKWSNTFTSGQVCDATNWGETEDYTITVSDLPSARQWDKRFGGSDFDGCTAMVKTSDGGYLLGGNSKSSISGDKSESNRGGYDYWVVKISSGGTKQWDKRFGGSADDYLNALIQTPDGGFLLGGNSASGIGGDKSQASRGSADYWVVKINSSGVKQWDKRFGGSAHDDLRAITPAGGSDFLLAGFSGSGVGGDKTQGSQGANDYWVVKINSSGTKLWDKRFGGSLNEYLEAAVQTSDGGYVLGGHSASGISGDKSQESRGGIDYWVIKINSSGTKVWDRRFGGIANDIQYAMARTSDGGFILGGESLSGSGGDKSEGSRGGADFWVVRINSSGSKLWDKRFGGNAAETLRSVIQTSDGGFLLGGKSESGIGGDKSQPTRGGTDLWTVKISSSGSKQWDKRFGGTAADEARSVLQTAEGGYLIGGRSESGVGGDKSQSSRGSADYWIVKVTSLGTASTSAIAREEVTPEEEVSSLSAKLHARPNPFTEKVTLSFSIEESGQVSLEVYDIQGKLVSSMYSGEAEADKFYEFELRADNMKAGMYLIRLIKGNKQVSTQKILLVK